MDFKNLKKVDLFSERDLEGLLKVSGIKFSRGGNNSLIIHNPEEAILARQISLVLGMNNLQVECSNVPYIVLGRGAVGLAEPIAEPIAEPTEPTE
ncbi:MAG TPA: hypothetical protein DEP72_00005, partial [Clostridiales bacterium]|nr:hypothetical protein [Clostridiales bacterium]